MKFLVTVALLLTVGAAMAQVTDTPDKYRTYDSTYSFGTLIKRDLSRNNEGKYIYTDPASLVGQQIIFLKRNLNYKGGRFDRDDTTVIFFRSKPLPVKGLMTEEMKAFIAQPDQVLYISDVANEKPKYNLAKNIQETTSIYQPTLYWDKSANLLFPRTNYTELEKHPLTITAAKLNKSGTIPFYEFELKDKAGEIITWKVRITELRSYDIVLSGQLAYLRSNWLNKNFYMVKSRFSDVRSSYTNILNGEKVEYIHEKKWHCTDIRFLMNEKFKFAVLYIILKDDKGVELAVTPEYDRFSSELPAEHLYTEKEYSTMKAKANK